MDKRSILNYIKQYKFLNLSTINSAQYPECRAMVNIMNKEIAPHLIGYFNKNDKIYIMTNTHSDKIPQIKKNNKSSIYFVDNRQFEGLLLTGIISEINDEEIKKDLWDNSWTAYYKGGLEGGDFSILEFTPNKYKFYTDLSVKNGDVNW